MKEFFSPEDRSLMRIVEATSRFNSFLESFDRFVPNVEEIPLPPPCWQKILPPPAKPSLGDIISRYSLPPPSLEVEEDSTPEKIFELELHSRKIFVKWDGDSFWELDSDRNEVGEIFFHFDEDSAIDSYAEHLADDYSFWADTISDMAYEYAKSAESETLEEFTGLESEGVSVQHLPPEIRSCLKDKYGRYFRPSKIYWEE